MNAFPAKYYYLLNGWVLRFTGGITYRANSVFPINYFGDESQIVHDIEIVEIAYQKFSLPTIFTMHDFYKPRNLDELLKNRGYEEDSPTNALFTKIDNLKRKEVNSDYKYELHHHRTKDFSTLLARNTDKDEEQQVIINQISERIFIPQKCFILATHNSRAIGTLMGVVNPEGYLYISDLFVTPDHRGKFVATSMIFTLIDDWAKKQNAKYIWLQVEVENHQAAKLYESLGMEKVYYYYYLRSH
jgi:ribosomal protein S18 acetylase RimI-like enzyme